MIILDSNKYYNLGSVSMTSDINGTVSQYIEYIPFGEEMYSAHRNTYNSPYRYTAKELDEETGLYYYGSRYYNPKLSIWLSVDPMVEKYISLSPYNYVMNNPIKYIDPDGRFTMSIHKNITIDAFRNSGLSAGWKGLFKLDVLFGVTLIADGVGLILDYHFDGKQNYNEVQSTWKSLSSKIDENIADLGSVNRKIGGNDAVLFGRLLHTVQDFYSHSNYVELYIEYYKKENDGVMPTSVPIYDVEKGGTSDSDFNAILKEKLRTGDFYLRDNEFIKPKGKEANKPTSHNKMNKDKADTPAGKLAKKVAIEHTTQIMKKVKETE